MILKQRSRRSTTSLFSHFLRNASVTAVAATLVTACGSPEVSESHKSVPTETSDANASSELTERVCGESMVPPAEYYDQLLKEEFERSERGVSLSLQTSAPVLYLDFDGETLQRGYRRGQSFILCSQTATIPASGISPADQDQIVTKVQAYFDRAGAAMIVTPMKPTSGDFTTIIVGGSYGSLGCRESRGILGVAPLDGGNANRNDIGFAFTAFVRNINTIADTVAHEAGHSYGLNHTRNQRDLMFASMTSSQEGFAVGATGAGRSQDGPAILRQVLGAKGSPSAGPVAPISPTPRQPGQPAPTQPAPTQPAPTNPMRPTIPGLPNLPIDLGNLPGLGSLAGIANLIPQLNPADILDISKLLPGLTNVIPGGLGGLGNLSGLDTVLTILGIAQGVPPTTPAPGAPTAPGSPLSGILNPQTIQTIGTLAGLAGFGNVTSAISVIQGVVNSTGALPVPGGTPSSPTQPPLTQIPDLSKILDLDTITDFSSLLAAYQGHTRVVASNYSGDTRTALMSALKVAYAQAYAGNIRSSMGQP